MTLVNQLWDPASGVRERLALLAAIGPTLDPHAWSYHPTRDHWSYCGGAREQQKQVRVLYIGPATVPLIQLAERWGIDRDGAFDVIWRDGEERIKAATTQLISDAARAVEEIDPDELERYAEGYRIHADPTRCAICGAVTFREAGEECSRCKGRQLKRDQ